MNSKMTDNEFVTIKEVATILNCSVQNIYNRLEKDFKPYLKIEKGKKRLDKAILEYIKPQHNSSEFKETFKPILNILENQIQEKDRQIEQLQVELSKEREHNREKDKQLLETLDKLAESQVALTAGQTADKQKALVDSVVQGQQAIIKGKEKKRWQFWKNSK